MQLNQFPGCAWLANPDGPLTPFPSGGPARTWRLRSPIKLHPKGQHDLDKAKLLDFLARSEARSFYGDGHDGLGIGFMGTPASDYERHIKHRYRFVFLGGCERASADCSLHFMSQKKKSRMAKTFGRVIIRRIMDPICQISP
jgi:hypothetical protein